MDKVAVLGIEGRATSRVDVEVIVSVDAATLVPFVEVYTTDSTMVYTDGEPAYRSLPNHEYVVNGVGEDAPGQPHTNGIERFWTMLKRGYVGTYHQRSRKHLHRYVDEFRGDTTSGLWTLRIR